jgi:FixJ family two-component response regulator/DNA-binding MarR family transcriptional regulator
MTDTVLLLDDDAAALNFLEEVLSAAGISCRTSSDPQQALAIVQDRPDIALIISDICMPTMNGIQFADRLNSLALQWRVPPVLFLTAHPTLERAVDALRLGAYDFLRKPVRPTELLEVVKRCLDRSQRRRSAPADSAPDVEKLIRQAERQRTGARGSPLPEGDAPGSQGHVSVLDTIEGLHKLRLRYADHKLDELAWDQLLELLRAGQKHNRLSVSALAISFPGTPTTTSLRRIGELTGAGYIEREPDAQDRRRDFLALTPKAHALLEDYLSCAEAFLAESRTENPAQPDVAKRR